MTHWKAVLACFLFAVVGWGFAFYGQSLFLSYLQAAHGWSAGFTSSVVASSAFTGSIPAVYISTMIHRIGTLAVLSLGSILTAIATLLIGLATEVGSSFAGVVATASFLLAGVGFTGMSIQPITAILLRVYNRDFGIALSVALTGASVGGILVPLAFVK